MDAEGRASVIHFECFECKTCNKWAGDGYRVVTSSKKAAGANIFCHECHQKHLVQTGGAD